VVSGAASAGQPAPAAAPVPPAPAAAPGATSAALRAGLIYLRGAGDGAIRAIDAGTGRLARTLPAAVPSPDWRWLYRLSAGAVEVVDPVTARVAASHAAPAWAQSIAVSANGRWLVLGEPGTARFAVQGA